MSGLEDRLVVVGGGAGGIGAACAAARLGVPTVLLEAAEVLGGTAVRSLVCAWEPVMGATGIPFDLYQRLRQRSGQVAIGGHGRHFCSPDPQRADYPGGECVLRPERGYADTLRRHGAPPGPAAWAWAQRHCFHVAFCPEAYAAEAAAMLAEAGVVIRCGAAVTGVEASDGRITALRLADGTRLAASAVVDASADAAVAAAAGCALRRGRDGRADFDEPGAPPEPDRGLNGVTQLYRITPVVGPPRTEPLPDSIPAACWWKPPGGRLDGFPPAQVNQLPDGDRVVNMLPTLDGTEFLALGAGAAGEARRRALAHWHWLQTHWPEFRAFRLRGLAPALGVREGPRIVAERTLTQHDLLGGLARQADDDLIALADHPFDSHGRGNPDGEVRGPYGIPFRCLVPRGWRNLLVACRGAGFSSIAASSCRLTRTMMQLGQAAGTAAALARTLGCDPSLVPGPRLRSALADQGVQLAWPMEPAVLARLAAGPSWATTGDDRTGRLETGGPRDPGRSGP